MPRELHLQTGLHLLCPHCACVMDRVELGTFCVDRCQHCGGIWLDSGELDKIDALKKAAPTKGFVGRIDSRKPAPRKDAGARRCPRDQSALAPTQSQSQRHVVVDRCPACLGIFLDPGELRDLAEHTLAERIAGLFRA